ncbi:MAG TPA: hypothetical protein VJ696_10460 [Rhodanobacteraceae bacterium]|nr:hypothetical protein [Rhodanobacteraceae bacterium]
MPKRILPALVLALLTGRAQAAEVDLAAGGSATIGVRWAPVAFLDVGAGSHEWAGLHWQPVATLGWIGSRNDAHDNLEHDVFIGGAGVRLVDWWGGAFVGLEAAYVDQRTDALSSHEQFISSLGWRGERFVIMVRHISNGDFFGGRNLGETMLLAGIAF